MRNGRHARVRFQNSEDAVLVGGREVRGEMHGQEMPGG
jgi:hypothetical protein